MEASVTAAEQNFDVDKLSYEIFSILESKFLFGYDDQPKLFLAPGAAAAATANPSLPGTPSKSSPRVPSSGRVLILSIDGGGLASDGLLAAASLARLEASLRDRSGDPAARIADFFDVAAGSGAGGVLATMLFTRDPQGHPLFSAEEALAFLIRNLGRSWSSAGRGGLFQGFRRRSSRVFRRVFREATLRDTVRPVLVPCYDLSSGAPFLFSRADAVENESFNFRLREVCEATCAVREPIEVRSVDGKTRITAIGGGVAMSNPTAAAITHVLNNKQEFPLAAGVEGLLVVSLGSGEAEHRGADSAPSAEPPSSAEIVRMAAEGVADMVDQAVAMAFGHNRASNYVRIQAAGAGFGSRGAAKAAGGMDAKRAAGVAEGMLAQRNVEAVLFRGKKLSEQTNAEKLDWFAQELVKEHDRRKASALPTVVVKPAAAAASAADAVMSSTAPETPAAPAAPVAAAAEAAVSPLPTCTDIAAAPPAVASPAAPEAAATMSTATSTAAPTRHCLWGKGSVKKSKSPPPPTHSAMVGRMLTTIL